MPVFVIASDLGFVLCAHIYYHAVAISEIMVLQTKAALSEMTSIMVCMQKAVHKSMYVFMNTFPSLSLSLSLSLFLTLSFSS